VNRRDLLKGSGALVVGFTATHAASWLGLATTGDLAAAQAPAAAGRVDSWIAVGGDGVVTAYTGKCELGQGLHTAQAQLVAEELSVPIARVRLIMCDTAVTPDQGTTSGSQSHPTNFNHANLALAAATAREALVDLAAVRLGVLRAQLTTADGFVMVRSAPTRRVAYADLIGGKSFEVPLNPSVRRKPHADWTVLGTSVARIDMPALATGQLEFVHNVRVPGMLHGRVIRPPEVGATIESVDEKSIAALPGVVRVVVKGNFVGIVAEKQWQAIQAASALAATWTKGTRLPAQAGFYDYLRQQPSRDAFVVNSGDVDALFSRAARVLKATYLHPYQMHGSLGASCAVADVQRDRATIWSSTQSAYPLRSTLSTLLGMTPDAVRVVFTRGAGCYGINGADAVAYDAALLSQVVGRPVRVQLSRQDEMAWENYGFAYVIDQRAAIAADGTITAWDHEAWYASLGGRPGYQTPGNVVTGRLAGFEPASVAPRAATAPNAFNNGSNAAPSYVTGCVGGTCGGTGTIKAERVLTHTIASPFFTGPLRSPSRLQNTFAHECFIDEIAAEVKEDPVNYRLRHLRDPRLIEVVRAAAKAARWQERPSPRPDRLQAGIVGGRGFATVLYEGDNGYCALVAEVDVDQSTGRIIAKRFVAAQDCGPISNPDGMKNQIEGGALQGLSRALGEEVTWDQSRVTSIDWRTYRSLTLGFEPPAIESVLIDRPGVEAMGAGETTITIVAAAMANAVFDATGVRLRQVPFTAERVKAALDNRARSSRD
jgi:nicotinate dehydrogenase subunit B